MVLAQSHVDNRLGLSPVEVLDGLAVDDGTDNKEGGKKKEVQVGAEESGELSLLVKHYQCGWFLIWLEVCLFVLEDSGVDGGRLLCVVGSWD